MNTFRMIIVDDEPMIRKGLRALIQRIAPHWVIIGDASNGQEALNMIRRANPDLVITDISMPVMDGIELFSKIKLDLNCPLVLALSGYTDYTYVRQMLLMGAVDYLTKPLEEPILIEKLKLIEDRVLASFHEQLEENEHNQQLSEFWFHQLLVGHSYLPEICEEKLKRLGLPTENVFYGAFALYHNSNFFEAKDRSASLYFLLKTSEELVHSHGKIIQAEDDLLLVLQWSTNEEELKDHMIVFRERLISFTEEFTRMKLSLGESSIFREFRRLRFAWERAKMEIRFHLISGSEANTVEWMVALQQRERSRIMEMVSSSFPLHQPEVWREQFIGRLAILGHFATQSGLSQHWVMDTPTLELLCQEQNTCSREMWMARLESLIDNLLEQIHQDRNPTDPHLIMRVKKYIQTHLSGNLTLQTTAEYIHMHPNYLSEVFKQTTGVNFIDYVIQQRMELAKKLLTEDKHKLYEIATMVGYQSSKHFTTLFKRVVGVLPSEYKRYANSTHKKF
ncbi:response regulator [Paenibacillus illinoisensis]|uniref:response regulator n=1 Tax=Paenibacillus illinoisensis TaxID=59845 RepID=UPI001C8EA852|nr:response regulator [Paenibacillus illinoisensis]MBY0217791.1 response regulator [Paenibacillus illinoisensis]